MRVLNSHRAAGLDDPSIIEFGPFSLDERERTLRRHGQPVPLTPKAVDVLLALVERPGRLIIKEELLQRVWPGVEERIADAGQAMQWALLDDGPCSVKGPRSEKASIECLDVASRSIRWSAPLEGPAHLWVHCLFRPIGSG